MPRSDKVLLDLNAPTFQEDLLRLRKEDVLRVLGTLRKIRQITWMEVYKDKGLRWERVQSKKGPLGERLYTIRISDGFRALVYRQEDFLRFLSLHPDHDSAYQ
ncbi:MAG TPA: hypothetical protein EYG28_02875 [Nitrospiria bacterium]|nr:hypothetical protein [Candidatus Manganitrophaceae bacterium]